MAGTREPFAVLQHPIGFRSIRQHWRPGLTTVDESRAAAPDTADAALVARARAGDARAFEAIMRLNNQRMFRTARAILRDDHEAEDAVQEAYVRAFSALAGFEGRSRLSTWLVRIVVNESLGRRRRRLASEPVAELEPERLSDDEPVLGLRMAGENPEKAAARGQIRLVLETAIDSLPETFRTVFVMRAVEQMSVAETAASLGIPEATVKTRFHRARRLLRLHLEDRLGTALTGTFPFAGARCDRIVARVAARLGNLSR